MKVTYLLLTYVEKPDDVTGPRIGVAYRRAFSEDWDIRCQLKEGWAKLIEKRDRSEVQGLIEELQGDDLSLRMVIWEALQRTSTGLLRAERQGSCEEQEVSSLLLAPVPD